MEVLDKIINFDFGYQIMSKLFQEGKITFTELCKYVRNETIPKRLTNMETKEINIEIPDGYEIDYNNSNFTKIVFKKKGKYLPKSWDELIFAHQIIWDNIKEKYGDVFIALAKLIELRDYYNDGWKPNSNFDDKVFKVAVQYVDEKGIWKRRESNVLAFKSQELACKFYDNFRDIIEQAKELL